MEAMGSPESDFLGFMNICWKSKNGRFWLKRKTISKRMRAKLAEVKDQLKRRRHYPFLSREHGSAAWREVISATTPCLEIPMRCRPSAHR
jgi:hypothetical protein